MYFWVVFSLQEAKRSLKRLRSLLCGKGGKSRTPPASAASSALRPPVGSGARAGEGLLAPEDAPGAVEAGTEPEAAESEVEARPKPSGGHRAGTGRLGADA